MHQKPVIFLTLGIFLKRSILIPKLPKPHNIYKANWRITGFKYLWKREFGFFILLIFFFTAWTKKWDRGEEEEDDDDGRTRK